MLSRHHSPTVKKICLLHFLQELLVLMSHAWCVPKCLWRGAFTPKTWERFFALFDIKYSKFGDCICNRFLVRPLWTGACIEFKYSLRFLFLPSREHTFFFAWVSITWLVPIVEHSKKRFKALSHAYQTVEAIFEKVFS